ncbi:MAG: AmmeMemoRadiSam system protein A [Coriobacteriia bacterium]|nr:AmmeMemoRadiSam system protein A [Coriobacteriia bacterium]
MDSSVLGIIAPHPPIMVPEVGGARAEVTEDSANAMALAARALHTFAPDVIVLMSPHAPLTRDAFVIDTSERLEGDLGQFGAGGVNIEPPGDPALAAAIVEEAAAASIPVIPRSVSPLLDAGVLDHGALVPLSFLDRAGRYPLVVISLAFLPLPDHRALGAAIRRAADRLGRKVAFVASGDCSHRLTRDAPAGYSPRGAEFDAELVRILSAGRFRELESLEPGLIEAAGECGLRSFIALGGFLEGSEVHTRVLAYEGPWGVGYLTAIAATPELLASLATPDVGRKGGMPGAEESEPVSLARRTIEVYVRERRVIAAPAAEGLLASRHGAFVSLHRGGMLRGCIGTVAPTQPTLAGEILHNAIQAATADPRFPPLEADELADLEISVDVLQPAEPATIEELDPRVSGVIVTADWRRGLLLPDLDGVDTAEDQIAIACQKAGIGPHENIHLERFRVDRYH